MKRYEELNEGQKKAAFTHALQEIKTLVDNGFLSFDVTPDTETLEGYAQIYAEDAIYLEKTDKVVDGIVE